MTAARLLVFDVGGTTARGGVYDPELDLVVARAERACTPLRQAPDRVAALVSLLEELRDALRAEFDTPTAAVVAFPGPVAPDGTVLAAPTLWPNESFETFSLADLLEEAWPGLPVTVLNDVTAAGHAYVTADRRDFCILTISSGIGHKVFVDGEALVGPGGVGGEIGHVVVNHHLGRVTCDCGAADHLGAVSSGRGVLRFARERATSNDFAHSRLARVAGSADAITNELLAECFRAGDDWTVAAVRLAMEPLGWMLATLRSAIGIQEYLLVGGFANALGPSLCDELASLAARASWGVGRDWAGSIELGELGDEAGLIGGGRVGTTALSAR